MKKKLGVVIGIIGILAAGLFGWYFLGPHNYLSEDEKIDYVDEQIHVLQEDDAYKSANTDTREEMAAGVLRKLRIMRYVKNVSYSSDSQLFSFQYTDGSLGGITLTDFSTPEGELAMN